MARFQIIHPLVIAQAHQSYFAPYLTVQFQFQLFLTLNFEKYGVNHFVQKSSPRLQYWKWLVRLCFVQIAIRRILFHDGLILLLFLLLKSHNYAWGQLARRAQDAHRYNTHQYMSIYIFRSRNRVYPSPSNIWQVNKSLSSLHSCSNSHESEFGTLVFERNIHLQRLLFFKSTI